MPMVELLRIVVASPGDVQAERDCVEAVATELNHGLAAVLGLRLDVIRWETDAFPGFNSAGAQGHIDASLGIEDADLVIGIFWKRFGTRVPDARSGTEHEIRNAYSCWERSGRPQIMVYFNQAPLKNPKPEENEQWATVKQFQGDPIFKKGLWWQYTGVQNFEGLLREHLVQYLRHRTTPVEMQVRTVDSPLGLMDVSGISAGKVRPQEIITPGLQAYRNPHFGFEISWPGATWQGNDNPAFLQTMVARMGLPPTLVFPLLISYRQPVMGFVPNVNVILEQVGAFSIRDYLQNTVLLVEQLLGEKVVNCEVDDTTQSGFIMGMRQGLIPGQVLYQFQRMLLSHGQGYTVTATQLPPIDQVGLRLRNELSTILNSFRLL